MKRLLNDNQHRYLSLIKELALTDFKLKYQGSVFGYLWTLAKPLALFSVYYFVFTKVFRIGGSIPHYPIYLLLGILSISFWNDATNAAMTSIVARGDLIRKVYFPRIVLVISSTMTAFLTFILNFLVIFVFAYFNKMSIELSAFTSIIYFFELYVLILGASFFLAAFYVKFRDIKHIWEVITQILFYVTPLLYTMDLVPDRFAKIMILSPLAQSILDIRRAFMGPSVISISHYWGSVMSLVPVLLVAILAITGYVFFQRMAAKFAEEI